MVFGNYGLNEDEAQREQRRCLTAASLLLGVNPHHFVGHNVCDLLDSGLKTLTVRDHDRRTVQAQRGKYLNFLRGRLGLSFQIEITCIGDESPKSFRIHAQRLPLVGLFRGAKTYIEGEAFSKAFNWQ